MLPENPHESDPELHELQLPVDDEVPWKRFAETRNSHTEVRGLGREWTERRRDRVEIIVDLRLDQQVFAVTFWSDTVPTEQLIGTSIQRIPGIDSFVCNDRTRVFSCKHSFEWHFNFHLNAALARLLFFF